MSYRMVMTLAAVLSALFGLGFFLAPAATLALYAVSGDAATAFHLYSAQWFGLMLLSFGALDWAARDLADPAARRAVVVGNVVQAALGIALSTWGALQGTVGPFSWVTTAIYAVLLTALLVGQRARPATA
jgi:hypothetical protein